MKVKIVKESNLDYVEEAINEAIDCLEYNGYKIVDIKYINEKTTVMVISIIL